MKKFLLSTLFFVSAAAAVQAQENKPQVKVGGLFFLLAHHDTYKSVDNREGLSYSFPMAPSLDEKGNDLNQVGQFTMSAYATRLYVDATRFKLLDADARVYAEIDFMGSGDSYLQMIRMRHAYLDLRWRRSELLFGQTSNLEMPDETLGGTLTTGVGSPIAILERPAMIRYGLSLGKRWKLYAAASYRRPSVLDPTNSESIQAARNSGFPSAEARIQYSSPTVFAGIAGGFKSVMPRTKTADGLKTNERFHSYSATAFLRLTFNGYRIKLQTVAGTDLTHLGLIGGYGKLSYPEGQEKAHYDYTGFLTGSAWLDFETKSYNGFQAGIFGGYMENFGAQESIDSRVMAARAADLNLTGRVAPRFTYSVNNLLFGIEHSLYFSRWGKTFNSRYQPSSSYDPTYNHRTTLLVRYTF
jgi:hypothetical protein